MLFYRTIIIGLELFKTNSNALLLYEMKMNNLVHQIEKDKSK